MSDQPTPIAASVTRVDSLTPGSGGPELTQDICWACDGSGKLRANYMRDGKYVFRKIVCHECAGRGELDYQKCPDCGDVVPAYCFTDHECGD